MILEFKRAEPKDSAVLVKLYDAAFYADFVKYGECPAYGRKPEEMEKTFDLYPKFLIYFGEEPIGAISYRNDGGGKYYVGCFCVIPKYQGMGVGTLTFGYLLEVLNDWTEISLITPSDNARNVGFYTKKCGFVAGEEEKEGNVTLVRLTKKRNG